MSSRPGFRRIQCADRHLRRRVTARAHPDQIGRDSMRLTRTHACVVFVREVRAVARALFEMR